MEYGEQAVAFVEGAEVADLESNPMLRLALLRCMEIVGEASNQLSDEARGLMPSIPWRSVVAMRNRLVHAYAHVNLAIIWSGVVEDLPPLLAEVRRVLEDNVDEPDAPPDE